MKKKLALLTAALTAALMCFALAGCDNNGTQANDGEGAQALEEITLVLDYTPNTNHTGIYVAQANGYFEEQGLKVNIVEPGDNDPTTLCAAGKAEFAVTYQENVTYARTAEEPLPIRAIATIVQHNTSGFVSAAEDNITSPKDFEGKVYAGWQAPSEEAVLKAVMAAAGADFSKLTMVGAAGSGLDSMGDQIDIQWEFEGWSVLNDRMNGHKLNYIPVKDLDQRLDYYTPLLITNEDMIANNPETVKAFVAAVKKGYEFAIEDPEAAAGILHQAIPETDQEFLLESQKFLSEQYSLDSATWGLMKDQVWDGYTEFMHEYGLIEQTIPASQQYTNEFIQ